MVFTNKSCDDIYSVCMNGLNLSRVFVAKFLGVHYGLSKLDWNDHINIVRNAITKNVSVMNRVKHVLTSSALYILYCTLVVPYLTYCCGVWGNGYKTRIHSLFIIQKRVIRICLNTDYKCQRKPLFYQLIFDTIDVNSLVFMYKQRARCLTPPRCDDERCGTKGSCSQRQNAAQDRRSPPQQRGTP